MKYKRIRPTEFTFMGRTYKITFPDKVESDDDDYGSTCHNNFIIQVKGNQIPLEEADTFLHEIMHVLWYHMGLCADNSDDVEERMVRTLSTALIYALRNNPNLLNYFKEILYADRPN